MRATGIAAPAPAGCRADGSEQERVASAFVSAAIRLGPVLLAEPAESSKLAGPSKPAEFSALAEPSESSTVPPYVGRHRRRITVRHGAPCQAARS